MRLALATWARCDGPATRRCSSAAAASPGAVGAHEGHRPSVDEESARLVAELADGRLAVPQRHRIVRDPHDVAAEPGGPILDDIAQTGGNDG